MRNVGDAGMGGCLIIAAILLVSFALEVFKGIIAWQIIIFSVAGFLLIFGIIGLKDGLSALADGLKRDKPHTYANPIYQPGSFRGEPGSPGTSPKIVGRHSVNCECNICLYGHDPDDALNCKCRSCEGYRRGKPIH